jgi:hypothetical protein
MRATTRRRLPDPSPGRSIPGTMSLRIPARPAPSGGVVSGAVVGTRHDAEKQAPDRPQGTAPPTIVAGA